MGTNRGEKTTLTPAAVAAATAAEREENCKIILKVTKISSGNVSTSAAGDVSALL